VRPSRIQAARHPCRDRNRGGLIDFGLFQPGGAGRAERNDEIAAGSPACQFGQRPCQHDGRLDRADAGHQRLEARAQEGAVFGIGGHHEQDGFARHRFQFERHPVIPSLPRMTIIVLVIEAISLAGPSLIA
jgi:hypothetical protein